MPARRASAFGAPVALVQAMARWLKFASILVSLASLPTALAPSGCSSGNDSEAPLRDDDGESAEDALEGVAEPTPIQSVEAYAAVPLEDRVVTAAVSGIPADARIVVVRSMNVAGVPSVLAYDARSLATYVVSRVGLEAASRKAGPADGDNPYVKKLEAMRREDATLERVHAPKPGRLEVALTVDMCQSSKPWDKALFDFLVDLSAQRRAPVPVGVAMTGGWAKKHPVELEQLRKWNASGALAIAWINHSYTHPIHCTNGGRTCTFLTDSSVTPEVFQHEVLDNERLLLRQGFAVSPLFRFPGLAHDATRRKALNGLSLFALDADAWLAKGERLHDGAVVLVHGNGNEPRGIELFLQAMRTETWRQGLRDGSASFITPVRAIAPD